MLSLFTLIYTDFTNEDVSKRRFTAKNMAKSEKLLIN